MTYVKSLKAVLIKMIVILMMTTNSDLTRESKEAQIIG